MATLLGSSHVLSMVCSQPTITDRLKNLFCYIKAAYHWRKSKISLNFWPYVDLPYPEYDSTLNVGNVIAIPVCWLCWTEILKMEGVCEEKPESEQKINVEKYRRLVKSYIDLVSITGP